MSSKLKLRFQIVMEWNAGLRLPKQDRRVGSVDCFFLFCAVVFSALPYLSGLGFYSDDWEPLAASASQSTGEMIRDLLGPGTDTRLRPVQVEYLVSAFKVFGQHPVALSHRKYGDAGIDGRSALSSPHEMRAGRVPAFSISLLFGLLPHYSTDRIWISSLQAIVCMGFAFLGVYALLRLDDQDEKSPRKWTALASVSFVLSLLSYEIAIGWIGAAIVLASWRHYRVLRASPSTTVGEAGWCSGDGIFDSAGLSLQICKQERLAMQHRFLQHFGETVWNAVDQALRFNLWTYGLDLYAVVSKAIRAIGDQCGSRDCCGRYWGFNCGLYLAGHEGRDISECAKMRVARRRGLWHFRAGVCSFLCRAVQSTVECGTRQSRRNCSGARCRICVDWDCGHSMFCSAISRDTASHVWRCSWLALWNE